MNAQVFRWGWGLWEVRAEARPGPLWQRSGDDHTPDLLANFPSIRAYHTLGVPHSLSTLFPPVTRQTQLQKLIQGTGSPALVLQASAESSQNPRPSLLGQPVPDPSSTLAST
jgi:hypothetical protein